MRVRQLEALFVLDEEGVAKKFPTINGQQLEPVGRGVVSFAALSEVEDRFSGKIFQASSLKEAARLVGENGLVGMPVGKVPVNRNGKLGFVYRVVRVEKV